MEKKEFTSFDQAMCHWLDVEDAAHKAHVDNDWWFASELGMCRRKVFLRRYGFPGGMKIYKYRFNGRDGTAFHEWREEAAEKLGFLYMSEGKIRDQDTKLSMRFDLFVKLGGRPVVVDIKSQKSEAFRRRKYKLLEDKIEDHQKLQLSAYVYFLKKHGGATKMIDGKETFVEIPETKELEEGRIYYIDRGEGVREEYVIRFTEKHYNTLNEELSILNGHWKEERIPKVQKQTWECNKKFCPYADMCEELDRLRIINARDAKEWQNKTK